MSSTKSLVVYHERMECNNKDVNMNIDSHALLYETTQEKVFQVSKVADTNNSIVTTTPQHVPFEHPNTIFTYVDDAVINIQLQYNLNALTEPDLWNGSFHPILLHGSIKHIALDSKNIKNSLNFMAKYIANKQVDLAKSNDLKDFKGIGEAIWNLISSVYQSKWDSLIADKNAISLRKKILDKLTLRIIPLSNCNNKIVDKPILANIEKIPLPIPAKSQKEVNQISKYFKNIKPVNESNPPNKSYAQASKQSYAQASKQMNNTTKVIKIKDTFPALNAQKINQIHRIINDSSKPKPCIQMTTKGPLRKQVIIPISNDNINKSMKDSLLHVANINQSLRNAKSEVLVDFICSDIFSITIVTNKVTVQSDLYIIENYIKKVKDIDTVNMDVPQLS